MLKMRRVSVWLAVSCAMWSYSSVTLRAAEVRVRSARFPSIVAQRDSLLNSHAFTGQQAVWDLRHFFPF